MTDNGQKYTTNWNCFALFGGSERFEGYFRQKLCLISGYKNEARNSKKKPQPTREPIGASDLDRALGENPVEGHRSQITKVGWFLSIRKTAILREKKKESRLRSFLVNPRYSSWFSNGILCSIQSVPKSQRSCLPRPTAAVRSPRLPTKPWDQKRCSFPVLLVIVAKSKQEFLLLDKPMIETADD